MTWMMSWRWRGCAKRFGPVRKPERCAPGSRASASNGRAPARAGDDGAGAMTIVDQQRAKLRSLRPRVARLDSRRVKPMPKVAAPFYQSRDWRALVAAVIAQR